MATRIGTSPTLQKTVVLTFLKKSIVTLSTRFQAQLLIPMFKNFRVLEILRIESLQKIILRLEFPRLKLPFIYRFEKFFCALNSMVKWLFITIWVTATLLLFSTIALLLIGVGGEFAQYLSRYLS